MSELFLMLHPDSELKSLASVHFHLECQSASYRQKALKTYAMCLNL
jgi:hypothetical protein